MATHSIKYSCLENPCIEQPGGLQPVGLHRVRHDSLWMHACASLGIIRNPEGIFTDDTVCVYVNIYVCFRD